MEPDPNLQKMYADAYNEVYSKHQFWLSSPGFFNCCLTIYYSEEDIHFLKMHDTFRMFYDFHWQSFKL
jgi:hypothetical protein